MNNVVYVDFKQKDFKLNPLIAIKTELWAEVRQLNKLIDESLTLKQFKPLMFTQGEKRAIKLKTLTKSKSLLEHADRLLSLYNQISLVNNEIDEINLQEQRKRLRF